MPGDSNLAVVVFEIDGTRYGLAARDVREIVRAVAAAPLTGAPTGVDGVINIRGEVVPVLDVRTRLGLPARRLMPSDHFIIARADRAEDRLVALRVDRALELERLEARSLERADALLPGATGCPDIARLPDGVLLVHDVATLLSPRDSAGLAESLRAAGSAQGGT